MSNELKKLNLKWVTETIGNHYKNWKKGDVVLISAQTGTGKTYFIKNELLDNLKEGKRILFVCNRTNLKRQTKRDYAHTRQRSKTIRVLSQQSGM